MSHHRFYICILELQRTPETRGGPNSRSYIKFVFGFTGLSPHPITDLRVMMPAAFASLCHPKGQVLLLAVLLLLAIYQLVYGGK